MPITRNVVTAEELLASIPEEFCLTKAEQEQLKAAHTRTISLIDGFTPQDGEGVNIEVTFGEFVDTGGRQFIAEGAVVDKSRPGKPAYNWHLQDTSQWLLGFGLVFDKERRDFSLHT